MKKILLLCVALSFTLALFAQEVVSIGQRFSLDSEILNEERSFQVYLPPSYHYLPEVQYPVIYLIDGDYNFHYVTGMIEQMANIGEVMPEMIVVGISDRGQANYIKNLTPTKADSTDSQSGNATNFLSFIQKELKPQINATYRTAPYEILIGHSIGGLFVVSSLLDQADAFNAYIAISPSLWWDDYAINKKADETLQRSQAFQQFLFLSLANETEMGVHEFVGVLDKKSLEGLDWTFKHYPEENHGSVGAITLKTAFEKLFVDWEMSSETFYQLEDFKAVSAYFQKQSKKLGYPIHIPENTLKKIISFYFRKDRLGELESMQTEIAQHFPASLEKLHHEIALGYLQVDKSAEAEKMALKNLADYPKSVDAHVGLGKIYAQSGDVEKAKKHYTIAMELAPKQMGRQWQINQIQGQFDALLKAPKK